MTDVVMSREDRVHFAPDDSPRTYTLAPLTFREANAYRVELTREAGTYPATSQMFAAMRAAIRELAAGNETELLAVVAQAEAEPDNADAVARLAAIEAVVSDNPLYSSLMAQRERHLGLMPFFAARHCLRGWEGPDLPPFRLERGLVPESLLEHLPEAELRAVGWRATQIMRPAPGLSRFSGAPSPSPETPAPTTES